jgi:hypothetical protein
MSKLSLRDHQMDRNVLAAIALIALVCGLPGCGSEPAAPTAPGIVAEVVPKLTAPTAQSPVNGQRLDGLAAVLNSTTATADVATMTLQYRFQVFNEAGTLALDSGLVADPTWTTVTLSPNKSYMWKVRAESQGWAGPWSDAASFVTPDPPPAFGPVGNWQACGGLKSSALVICVWNTIRPKNSVGDLEVIKRVAWLLRGEGAGLLIKAGGENVVLWQGYSLSATRICYPDGHIYKLIGDAGPGGANSPGWADNNDFVDKSLYVPAIDPSKP